MPAGRAIVVGDEQHAGSEHRLPRREAVGDRSLFVARVERDYVGLHAINFYCKTQVSFFPQHEQTLIFLFYNHFLNKEHLYQY